MGCLFWSDFEPNVLQRMRQSSAADDSALIDSTLRLQDNINILLVQYRKYINYFVEQSLINGMWGAYPHSVIALASILIARFEILKIDQVQYRKKKPFQTPEKVRLLKTWNHNFKVYAMNVAIPPEEFWNSLEKCCVDIYMKIFDGASFPFWHEVGQYIDEKKFIIEEIDLNFMVAGDAS